MWFAFFCCFALFYFSNTGAIPQNDSSVSISVDTDVNNKQMTRIDFIEAFHPLSSASAVKGKAVIKGHAPPRIRAPSPRVEHSSIQQLHELQLANKPRSSSFPIVGEEATGWQQWGPWSSCFHFERVRVRSCWPSTIVHCIGDRSEKQLCLRSGDTNILVAKDPWAVEREINRSYLNDKVNNTSQPKK